MEIDTSRDLAFRIQADLTSLRDEATDALKLAGLGDAKFWVDLFGDEGLNVAGEVLHTSTTNRLGEFGVQVGLLGMQESSSGVGAFALGGADFRLDVSGEFSFSDIDGDDRLTLGEMKSLEDSATWDELHDFTTPTGGGRNTADFTMQVAVDNDPGADTHIGGITGVTGTLSFSDDNLFDESAPMATTDGTLAAFSRLTSQDILDMAGGVSGWAAALQASGIYGENVPFLDLSTGDAYAFGEAFEEVFLSQLRNVEQVQCAFLGSLENEDHHQPGTF